MCVTPSRFPHKLQDYFKNSFLLLVIGVMNREKKEREIKRKRVREREKKETEKNWETVSFKMVSVDKRVSKALLTSAMCLATLEEVSVDIVLLSDFCWRSRRHLSTLWERRNQHRVQSALVSEACTRFLHPRFQQTRPQSVVLRRSRFRSKFAVPCFYGCDQFII